MTDNSQTTEEQRAEAFRQEHAQHLRRQTQALESIRNILVVWLILAIIGGLLLVRASSQGF